MSKMSAIIRRLALVLAVAAMVSAVGCAKKAKDDEGAIPGAGDENALGDSDSGKAMGMKSIHFGYDAYSLDSEAKSVLKANAEILKSKSGVKIQVEGHCDARGGIQYNIALGDKRANSTKKFLQDLGVSADRITTISYGKERPIDPGTSEEAYGKNRRANFAITSK